MTFAVPANAYDRFVGRYSYALCDALVQAVGPTAEPSVLDVGAGTGVGTRRLVELVGPERVTAVDASEPFTAALRERFPDVDVRLGQAESLPFADDTFDLAVALLVVNFMSDAPAGVAEMKRVTRPGGAVAACVWDYAGEMTLLRAFWDAAHELDPDGVGDVDERARMSFASKGTLGELWRRVGFDQVEDGELVVAADYASFEDLWEPFTQGVGPAGGYAASLTPDRQQALEARYRGGLVVSDGPFRLTARAWYAIGRT